MLSNCEMTPQERLHRLGYALLEPVTATQSTYQISKEPLKRISSLQQSTLINRQSLFERPRQLLIDDWRVMIVDC